MAIIPGNEQDNELWGTNGADTMTGEGGNDILQGYGGNDLLSGGRGYNELWGGGGFDTASYADASSINVDLGYTPDHGWAYEQGVQRWDELHGIENIWATNGNDVIKGAAGPVNNEFFGRGGDDSLEGRGGADKLSGGAGFDTASYERSTGSVWVDLNSGVGGGGEATGDRLLGIERLVGSAQADSFYGNGVANTLEGRGGGDYLLGGGGADTIKGGAGADHIQGDAGADTLFGEGGGDSFMYVTVGDSNASGADIIEDFNHSQGDRIDLALIDAKPGQSGDQAFQFIGDNAFSAVGQVRAYDQNGGTWVEVNAASGGGAEMRFFLDDVGSVSAQDFVL